MAKRWDTLMVASAGALLGLLASVGHIIADRAAAVDVGPVPIAQVPLYVVGAAALFAFASILRNRLVMRRGDVPTASG